MKPSRCPACRAPLVQPSTGRRRRTCSAACRQALYRQRRRKHRLAPLFASDRDDWATPRSLFAELDERFGPFTLDPCASADNATCGRFFTRDDDGLAQEWTGRVFMNPPYSDVTTWMRKAWEASQTSADLVVCLVPARTDTVWWHDYASRGEFEFRRGRVRFGAATNSAPFPSALVVFRHPGAVTKQRPVEEQTR